MVKAVQDRQRAHLDYHRSARHLISTSPTRWMRRFRPTPSPCPPARLRRIVGTAGTAGNTTDTEPVSIVVDPALGRFVYTANYLGNSVSGFKLNPSDGTHSANSGHALPHRRESHSPDRRSAWQPPAVNAVSSRNGDAATVEPSHRKPCPRGWGFLHFMPAASHCDESSPLRP